MPRIVTTEQPAVDVCRYLRHWATTEYATEQVQSLHGGGVAAEKRRRKGRDIAASVAQGLELLENARSSSLLTKPLPLFYATEAFAKAVSIFLNPALESSDFRAHGLQGIKGTRYFVRTLACRVQTPGSDVWSRLVSACNADWVQISATFDGVSQVFEHRDDHGTPALGAGSELVLGELLRHLPELAEDLPFAHWSHPYVVHVPNFSFARTTGPPPSSELRVFLRHAHDAATKQMIIEHETGLGDLRRYTRGRDLLDVLEYSIGPTPDEISSPTRRLDIFGELFFDFARTRSMLGELPLYYGALFILSDFVRYQGQWQRLLDDHPEEAVLIDRLLDLSTRKIPNLVLNELSRRLFLFRVGR
jgi:YaaC-like protein